MVDGQRHFEYYWFTRIFVAVCVPTIAVSSNGGRSTTTRYGDLSASHRIAKTVSDLTRKRAKLHRDII